RSDPLNDQFKMAANGVTRFGLGQYPMKNAYIAVPPLDLQLRITRFLDVKTMRIDGLITKVLGGVVSTPRLREKSKNSTQSLLALLLEYRSALITAAVTGRIDVGGG